MLSLRADGHDKVAALPAAAVRRSVWLFTRGVDGTLEASNLTQPSQTRPPATGLPRTKDSTLQVWHFPGQKLRLGGGAMGADPTYLFYLPFRSRGGI